MIRIKKRRPSLPYRFSPRGCVPTRLRALVLHDGACSGDVGILNLLWTRRPDRVWTYDDVSADTSFFFRSVAPPQSHGRPRPTSARPVSTARLDGTVQALRWGRNAVVGLVVTLPDSARVELPRRQAQALRDRLAY